MLEISSVTRVYESRHGTPVTALQDVSLGVSAGELVVLQGPSGSGKTTLLLAAGGLLPPSSGKVEIEGRDLYSLPGKDISQVRAQKIGFVFQQFHLVPYLNVIENVLAPTLACPQENARGKASAILDELKLGARALHYPSELSTGERQRTALARALLNDPALILADEPTGNLDRENAGIVIGRLSRFVSSGGAVLMVTHGPDDLSCIHRRIKIEGGRIVGTE